MNTRSLLRSLVAAAGVSAVAFGPFAVPAAADPATDGISFTNHHEDGLGAVDVLNGDQDVFLHIHTLDGGAETTDVFCLQYGVGYIDDPSVNYNATDWDDVSISNLAKAVTIAEHHATLGTPLGFAPAETVAAQLAVWGLTDSYDYRSEINAGLEYVADRADELVALVNAPGAVLNTPVEADAKLTITDVSVADGGTYTVAVSVLDAEGDARTDGIVSATIGSETVSGTPDGSGNVTLTITAPDVVEGDEVDVAYTTTVAPGVVLVPATAGQVVVTSEAVELERVASAALPQQTPPTTEAPPTTQAPPTTEAPPTTQAPPTTVVERPDPPLLPETGPGVAVPLVLGAGAAASTAGALWRRRLATKPRKLI